MARVDIQTVRGEDFIEAGTITKVGIGGYPNATLTGFNLLVTVKRKRSDALSAAIVAKALTALTGYTVADVTLAVGGAWTWRARNADTSAFTASELLTYDVVLTEPDGTRTVVQRGTWKVLLGPD